MISLGIFIYDFNSFKTDGAYLCNMLPVVKKNIPDPLLVPLGLPTYYHRFRSLEDYDSITTYNKYYYSITTYNNDNDGEIIERLVDADIYTGDYGPSIFTISSPYPLFAYKDSNDYYEDNGYKIMINLNRINDGYQYSIRTVLNNIVSDYKDIIYSNIYFNPDDNNLYIFFIDIRYVLDSMIENPEDFKFLMNPRWPGKWTDLPIERQKKYIINYVNKNGPNGSIDIFKNGLQFLNIDADIINCSERPVLMNLMKYIM